MHCECLGRLLATLMLIGIGGGTGGLLGSARARSQDVRDRPEPPLAGGSGKGLSGLSRLDQHGFHNVIHIDQTSRLSAAIQHGDRAFRT